MAKKAVKMNQHVRKVIERRKLHVKRAKRVAKATEVSKINQYGLKVAVRLNLRMKIGYSGGAGFEKCFPQLLV